MGGALGCGPRACLLQSFPGFDLDANSCRWFPLDFGSSRGLSEPRRLLDVVVDRVRGSVEKAKGPPLLPQAS